MNSAPSDAAAKHAVNQPINPAMVLVRFIDQQMGYNPTLPPLATKRGKTLRALCLRGPPVLRPDAFNKARAIEARGRSGQPVSFLAGLVTARLAAPLRRATRGAWSRATRFLAPDLSAAGLGLGDGAGAFDGGWFLRFHDPTVCPPLQGHNTPLANGWTQLGLVPTGIRRVTSATTAPFPNPCASVSIRG